MSVPSPRRELGLVLLAALALAVGLALVLDGPPLPERGRAWTGALRLVLAFTGTWLLARKLRLAALPSAFAAVAFTLSGAVVLDVAPDTGRALAGLPWSAQPAAAVARAESLPPAPAVDAHGLVALGVLAIAVVLAARYRRLLRARETAGAGGEQAGPPLAGLAGGIAAFGAWAWIASHGGGSPTWRVAFLFDAFGAAGVEPWRAPGTFADVARAWIALPVWGLALAALFEARPSSPGRRVIAALALVFGVLALQVPGVPGLWSAVPLAGRVDPGHAAPVAALFLALVAAGALQEASVVARRAGAFVLALIVLAALSTGRAPDAPAELPRVDLDDELVGFLARPEDAYAHPPRAPGGSDSAGPVALWVAPELGADAQLVAERLDGAPLRLAIPLARLRALDGDPPIHVGAAGSPGAASRARPGAAVFACAEDALRGLAPGWWTLRVEFTRPAAPGRDPELLGRRTVANLRVHADARLGRTSALLGAATLLLLAFGAPGKRAIELAFVALALASGFLFARGMG